MVSCGFFFLKDPCSRISLRAHDEILVDGTRQAQFLFEREFGRHCTSSRKDESGGRMDGRADRTGKAKSHPGRWSNSSIA